MYNQIHGKTVRGKKEKDMKIYPMKLRPYCRKTIWGGYRLASEFGKGEKGELIGETWELSARSGTSAVVSGGEYDGKALFDLVNEYPDMVKKGFAASRFPLLIKFIDAADDLSIQVHPDDAYATAYTDDSGKTEMWYIVDAAKDAEIVYGLKEKYDRARFKKALEDNVLEPLLNRVRVKKGETYFIPSGMVHAICKGVLICEIQQNSDITYRVYDYNRRQSDGTLRKLHVSDALNVIKDCEKDVSGAHGDYLADCGYFKVRKLSSPDTEIDVGDGSFLSVICIDGETELVHEGTPYKAVKGDCFFIPAGAGKVGIKGGEVITAEI